MAGPIASKPGSWKGDTGKRLINLRRHGADGVAAKQHVKTAEAPRSFIDHLGVESYASSLPGCLAQCRNAGREAGSAAIRAFIQVEEVAAVEEIAGDEVSLPSCKSSLLTKLNCEQEQRVSALRCQIPRLGKSRHHVS